MKHPWIYLPHDVETGCHGKALDEVNDSTAVTQRVGGGTNLSVTLMYDTFRFALDVLSCITNFGIMSPTADLFRSRLPHCSSCSGSL